MVGFERRRDWTRAEWVVALDACPKDYQRYNASSRDVREVAFLIGRTPAAVSRGFANIWAALTNGREGLSNYSMVCREVVADYRRSPDRIHSEAIRAREEFLGESIWPRIEIRSPGANGVLEPDLRRLALRAYRETGLPRTEFALYRREGTLIEGAVLVSSLLGGAVGAFVSPVAERFVRWIESRVRDKQATRDTIEVLRNRVWVGLRDNAPNVISETIIAKWLPELNLRSLDSRSKSALASFLSPVLGVSRLGEAQRSGHAAKGVPPGRVSQMERQTGARLSRLRKSDLEDLDQLLKVVDTAGFRRAVKQLQQTRLDDFVPSRRRQRTKRD